MRFIIALLAMTLPPTVVWGQQPYAGMETRTIKSLSEQQVGDLRAGRGMGLALAAELNGYPGPAHAIEFAERLGLSPDQLAKTKQLFDAMRAEAIPLGEQLIEQERRLNAQFAGKAITLETLEKETQQIGATQAKLRAAHLKYHLSAVAILTPQQVANYEQLRGYSGSVAPAHRMRH